MNQNQRYIFSKVPEVTLVFWIVKILATTLGETGGDALSMSLNLGYLLATGFSPWFLLPQLRFRSGPENFTPLFIGLRLSPPQRLEPRWQISQIARLGSATQVAPSFWSFCWRLRYGFGSASLVRWRLIR